MKEKGFWGFGVMIALILFFNVAGCGIINVRRSKSGEHCSNSVLPSRGGFLDVMATVMIVILSLSCIACWCICYDK